MFWRRHANRVLDGSTTVERPFTDEVAACGSDEADALERAHDEARENGYREGRRQAEQEQAAELEKLREEISDSLKRLVRLEEKMTAQHEARLLEIAIEAASRIVRQRLEEGDEIAARALQEAMESLPSGAELRIRINPDELDSLSEMLRAEIEAGRVELISDPAVSRGGPIVESEVGTVDATLETATAAARFATLGGGES
jgi:flagellar assembly protein FliH